MSYRRPLKTTPWTGSPRSTRVASASVSWISPPRPGRGLAQHLEDLGREHVAADDGQAARRLVDRRLLDQAGDRGRPRRRRSTGCVARLDGHGAVLVDVLPADVEQGDDRAAVLGLDGEHVLEQVVAGVDQVVAEQHRERLVADERRGLQHGVPEAPGLALPDEVHLGDARSTRARRPAGRRRPSSPAPSRAPGCRSKKSSMAALLRPVTISTSGRPGAGGLLDDVLQRRAVDDRQQLLGHGLGGRAGSGCPSRRRG